MKEKTELLFIAMLLIISSIIVSINICYPLYNYNKKLENSMIKLLSKNNLLLIELEKCYDSKNNIYKNKLKDEAI
jgi:hypothetical protein